ncbi:MAG TPA: hypothetical protein VMN99_11330, partial [Anaerolineales bacterium]|nr:hypothetical protein [Anaerolineales bacterium]
QDLLAGSMGTISRQIILMTQNEVIAAKKSIFACTDLLDVLGAVKEYTLIILWCRKKIVKYLVRKCS